MTGLYETLNAFELLARFEPDVPAQPFDVEIVAADETTDTGATGLPIRAQRTCDRIGHTDIVIVPLMMVRGREWRTGRYPRVVEWLRRMHRHGALLCSTCTGVLLLAETGLLDDREATIHWAFAPTFERAFPNVRLRTEEVLITTGERQELVMTGGVMSWHDLALHLIATHVGPTAAQAMARLLMLEWHGEGQAPYIAFTPGLDHGDALVVRLQKWIERHYMIGNPVEEMASRCRVARRTLERRFRKATGYAPVTYVQHIRIEEARKRLERTSLSVEEISSMVGYENVAFFRRVFARSTRMTPAAYRQKFQFR